MARNEQDREDILRDATALFERAELSVEGCDEPVVVGFRRGGAGSVYFGADPVYQFDSHRRLRRAYEGGRLIKAEAGALVELTRERTPREVQLVRRSFGEAETAQFLERARKRLAALHDAGIQGKWGVTGQVPPSGDVVQRIAAWLDSLVGAPIEIAHTPHAR